MTSKQFAVLLALVPIAAFIGGLASIHLTHHATMFAKFDRIESTMVAAKSEDGTASLLTSTSLMFFDKTGQLTMEFGPAAVASLLPVPVTDPRPDVIRASMLLLDDPDGSTVALMSKGMVFTDASGVARVRVLVDKDGPLLTLNDKDGEAEVVFGVED